MQTSILLHCSVIFSCIVHFLKLKLYSFLCGWMQKDFDMVWCRGTVKEKIFEPWIDFMRTKGCEILEGRRVTDFSFTKETSCISEVICGRESYNADAVILAVGISRLQELIKNRCAVFLGICTSTLLSLLLEMVQLFEFKFQLVMPYFNASYFCKEVVNSITVRLYLDQFL